jgi:AraC family transcriptional regulator, regulatory protein of adaptative response / methylated-DNA-[protein]-cysteine methyltransferase
LSIVKAKQKEKKMTQKTILNNPEDYQRIEKAIQFVETHFKSQPTLEQMAKSVYMSKFHFNRLFKRWVGVTPNQFMQYLTLEYTKEKLVESCSLLDTSLDAGLSGPSRLHDLFISFEAMTPGEYKQMGAGLDIQYGFGNTPFGECLVACTSRGICHLGFVPKEGRSESLNQLKKAWPEANFLNKAEQSLEIINRIFKIEPSKISRPFHLHLKGTNFQVNVWRALLSIPEGKVVTYQDIATYIGRSTAFRAVANAIAINPIGYLIPCHRVIAKSGATHQYRWGSSRKKAIIGYEAVKTS